MKFWSIVDQNSPDEEPNTAERAEHVEDGLPAPRLTEVAGDRHGDDCPEWSPSTDEGGEPGIVSIEREWGDVDPYLTCSSLVEPPIEQSLRKLPGMLLLVTPICHQKKAQSLQTFA